MGVFFKFYFWAVDYLLHFVSFCKSTLLTCCAWWRWDIFHMCIKEASNAPCLLLSQLNACSSHEPSDWLTSYNNHKDTKNIITRRLKKANKSGMKQCNKRIFRFFCFHRHTEAAWDLMSTSTQNRMLNFSTKPWRGSVSILESRVAYFSQHLYHRNLKNEQNSE